MVDPSGSIMSLNRFNQHCGYEALVSLSEDGSMKFWVSKLAADDKKGLPKKPLTEEEKLERQKLSL